MLATKRRQSVETPYPGLRSFEAEESMLFHGRGGQVEELLRRLAQNRFLAVVGGSGSGKSSLVRAGLLPALYRGYLVGASSRWRVAVMRPGSSPLTELAKALAGKDSLGAADAGALRESSFGLVNAVRAAALPPGESLLLVVDQFEELFRFRRESADGGAEASLFVSQLLQAAESFGAAVYVVITMRSDFLGDCSQFAGLPEALNKGQYLIPRMTREERREAITASLDLFDATMSDRLVQRLLNDAGDDPDQLPVLQHALQQTFAIWVKAGRVGEIDLEHYDQAGTMDRALHEHAQRVYEGLDESRWIAERVFRCLTVDENGRAVRRPAKLERILRVIGVAGDARNEPEAVRVIKEFAAPENSFLLWAAREELRPESVVDISHESLIRKWTTLRGWVREEAKGVEIYRYLRRDASLYPADAGLWSDPELAGALKMREAMAWNEDWAAQFSQGAGTSFAGVEKFLDLGVREREEQARQEQRSRWLKRGVAVLALVLLIGGVKGFQMWQERQAIQAQLDLLKQDNKDLVDKKADVDRQAAELTRQLDEAPKGGEQDPKLVAELDRLNKEKESLLAQQKLLTKNTDQVKQVGEDNSKSLAVIGDLQRQLSQVTRERDEARQQLQYGSKAQVARAPAVKEVKEPDDKEGEELKAQLARLQAEIRRLSSLPPTVRTVRASPTTRVVMEKSWGIVKNGDIPRYSIILGDLSRDAKTVPIYFLPPKDHVPPPGGAAAGVLKAKLAELSKAVACPTQEHGGVHCFLINKAEVNTKTQLLGTISFGDYAYQVQAMGWLESGISLTTWTTTVPSAGAKPAPAVPTQVATLKLDTDGVRFANLGSYQPEWTSIYLYLTALSTDSEATVVVLATDSDSIAAAVKKQGSQAIQNAVKLVSGRPLALDTGTSCKVVKGFTCWVTLPSGQKLGVSGLALGYVSGKAELGLWRAN